MQAFKSNIILLFLLLLSYTIFGQGVKLMSYNIRYDNKWDKENNWEFRKEKIVQLIKHYNPSIVGIQEGLINQVDYLDSSLVNYNFIGVGREDGIDKGEFSAIYYDTLQFRVIENSTFWFSETPDTISKGWDAALERICTYGIFEKYDSKRRFLVLNVHFDHVGIKAREKSSELLLKYINRINLNDYPVVLMGDFNSTPKEVPIVIIKSKLKDGLEISKNPFYGPIGTFNGFQNKEIFRRIDYVFTQNLNVLSYTHIDDRLNNNRYISDHLPILIAVK